jgi:alkanesulfonate monooxygenase
MVALEQATAGPPATARIAVFSTCPPVTEGTLGYRERVVEVARWSEQAGCEGILIYTDNRQLDPWQVANLVLAHTESLSPLVAVQPAYMHPYTVAKMVTSLAVLFGRRVHLNMVCGGFKNDLVALDDDTAHDRRYDRLVEYTSIVQRLLAGGPPLHVAGDFYRVAGLRLTPALPADLQPDVFVSGSSAAGLAAARALGAIAVQYPGPDVAGRPADGDPGLRRGIRIGIIARESEDEAWRAARRRFPPDRAGQLTHQLATRVSDSVWHRQLSAAATPGDPPYWLVPFQNYQSMCPYLVGSHRRVGDELGRWFERGYGSVILDVPRDQEELAQARAAFPAWPAGVR